MIVSEGLREAIRTLIRKRTGSVAAKVVGVDRVTLYRAANGKASAETIRKITEAFVKPGAYNYETTTATTATTTPSRTVHVSPSPA